MGVSSLVALPPGLSKGAGQIPKLAVIRRQVVRRAAILHCCRRSPIVRATIHPNRGHHTQDRQRRRAEDSEEVYHHSLAMVPGVATP